MRIGTIYSASDKSLFDALNQKNVTNNDLRELFLSRGILVSKDTSRRELAKHFSRLNHDYFDYQRLAKLFGGKSRRDRMSSIRTSTPVELSVFESTALDFKADLEKDGASVRVTSSENNHVSIEVQYQSVQFNKSEFRQVVNRTATIVIEKQGNDIVIYGPASDEAQEWISKISKEAASKFGQAIDFREIRLSPALSIAKKNEFFALLVKGLDGFKLEDVSDVYVSRPKKGEIASSAVVDNDDEESIEIGTHISKASLRGQGVMQSDELRMLAEKEFFVSKIVWTAKRPTLDSDIYEFEAQFGNPDEGAGFSYLPRGFYKYQGPRSYNETRTGFSKDEDAKLGKIIETAARKVLQTVDGVTLT